MLNHSKLHSGRSRCIALLAMKKLVIASLLASAINAQYNLTYLHLIGDMEPTLTLMGSDETATTYEKVCPETTTPTPTPSSTEEPFFGTFRTLYIAGHAAYSYLISYGW
jgi:hypothetical protein